MPLTGSAAMANAQPSGSQSYAALIRSLEVAIEQAFAGLASAFTLPAGVSLHGERDRVLRLLDALADLVRDQGDGLLTVANAPPGEDSLKDCIADLRRRVNQITGSNAKVAAQVLSKASAAQRLSNKLG